MREEELKNKVAADIFTGFDCTQILGNIDFTVASKNRKDQYFLWAEAKKDSLSDKGILKAICQLVLTIGKAKAYAAHLPPKYLGVMDSKGVSFYEFNKFQDILTQNDFNWNVTPSNTETREFDIILKKVESIQAVHFNWEDKGELQGFISKTFRNNSDTKVKVNKDNFISIYLRWVKDVKPSIRIDWTEAKKQGIIDGDFFLADLLSKNGISIKKNLRAVLEENHYTYKIVANNALFNTFAKIDFIDNQKAYNTFWATYARPPKEEFWDYMIKRRDLLVPQDIREIKGAYFTPRMWVEKAQEYISSVLGENWQDDYYIWDCACGTGNLLFGLVNPERVFASTLDQSDVDVIYDSILNGNSTLSRDNVFQFDFLNDGVSEGLTNCEKIPEKLRKIVKDSPEKIIMFINPPYAEASNAHQSSGTGSNRTDLKNTKTQRKYQTCMGKASNELFIQFFMRIYEEIPYCHLAEFSKLKILQGSGCDLFRQSFKAHLDKGFVVPSWTFDNVKGSFPIGFMLWDCNRKESFNNISLDVFSEKNELISKKHIESINYCLLNKWFSSFSKKNNVLGYLKVQGTDFLNNNYICIQAEPFISHNGVVVVVDNLMASATYLAIRKIPEHTWLNDRDQYFAPNDKYATDLEFQSDCLAWTLFNNNVDSRKGMNHWIPFTEKEVGSTKPFGSHFMTDFMAGKIATGNLIERKEYPAITFSSEAKNVLDCGKELWKLYMKQNPQNVDAGLYEIKEYFCGRTDKGILKTTSDWSNKYNELMADLKAACKVLAAKIEPKIYELGFLR